MNETQKLKWYILSGITETISESPINRLKTRTLKVVSKPDQHPTSGVSDIASEVSQSIAARADTLESLYQCRNDFDGCALKKTAAHTLNGRGVKNPDVLCYVEAPDTADEREGILMAGPAGVLLDKMLLAIGLNLNQNAYVSSLIPWRPPGNRKPSDVELALCRPFWEKEIALLRPKIILLFGANVSGAVLGITALSKARGSWHDYQGIPVRVSIAPATLIKLPAQKKQAWEDLQQVQKKLNEIQIS
ncbi:MAG: uracil-DNA glycosylase [Pseudomonadota bacterium]|nr:uracil-DNA glycosylase [Pseudomonadota bacterium]